MSVSPMDQKKKTKLVQDSRASVIEKAKKAQVASQINARVKAEKRKVKAAERVAKRKLENPDLPAAKKRATNDARIIKCTERDIEHIKNTFSCTIVYLGNINTVGLFCGYDATVCPLIVYPVMIGPFQKDTPIMDRDYVLGVGKPSNVFTGIRQAFGELYPEYQQDRVYDWELLKWNKKLYKAATLQVSVDQHVLAQNLYRSKSFGGSKHLPAVKVTDEIKSERKMGFAIEVAKYIETLPDLAKDTFPKDYNLMRVAELRDVLDKIAREEKLTKDTQMEVSKTISESNLIADRFQQINKRNSASANEGSETESEESESDD